MFLGRKLRFGATLMIFGSLLAAVGEIVNTQTTDLLSSSWRLSLGLIVVGTFILLIGLSTFASVSDQINGFGFVGSNLLVLGGLLLIVGTIALDWIVLPFLVNLANTIAATINAPTTATQNELNAIIASLNRLGGSTLGKLFPGAPPHISPTHLPMADGTALVNKALIQLHLPTIDQLKWWGQFSLAGGTLTVGSLVLGVALLRGRSASTLTSALLIIFALLNLLCQFSPLFPAFFAHFTAAMLIANISAAMLFLTLGWLGVSAWVAKPDKQDPLFHEGREIGCE